MSQLYINGVKADKILRRTLSCLFIKGVDGKLYKVSAYDYDHQNANSNGGVRVVAGVALDGDKKS